MTAEIDGGRILRQLSFPLTPDDTAFTVNAKCYDAAAESFAALIEDLRCDPPHFIEQTGPRSYFGRKDRPDGAATIDLGSPAAPIVTLVRALDFGAYQNPLGRAKLFLGDDVLLVGSAEITASRPSGSAGRLILGRPGPPRRILRGRGHLLCGTGRYRRERATRDPATERHRPRRRVADRQARTF